MYSDNNNGREEDRIENLKNQEIETRSNKKERRKRKDKRKNRKQRKKGKNRDLPVCIIVTKSQKDYSVCKTKHGQKKCSAGYGSIYS